MTPDDSSTHSSRQHSPCHTATNAQPSDTALHRVKPNQGDVAIREQKPTAQQRPSEQKLSSRSKTARSAEKPGGRTEKHSSRHRSSSLKHKPSGGSSKHQSSSKT